jgi:streptomycin 6-kinase
MMFNEYLQRWKLTPDGKPVVTATSRLLPVRIGGVPAMLKLAVHEEEKRGGLLMVWWDGIGAARVLAHSDDAILMERATTDTPLADLARTDDDQATRIICGVVEQLHAPRSGGAPPLVPLTQWFEPLYSAAEKYGGIFRPSVAAALQLLENQRDISVLHGDIHHGNVLNFGMRGWLAIDPKSLIGDRYFDYANILCNPDDELVFAPSRLARQATVIAEVAQLDRRRLLAWVLAWAGLSAAFLVDDGLPPHGALRMADLAASLAGEFG